MNLLIIEKDPQLYKIWAIQLKRLRYDFVMAPDCESAKQAIEVHGLPDVIIIDCPLVDAEGNAFTSQLDATDPERRMLRYLVTGNPDIEQSAALVGFDGVFVKPLEVKYIINVINEQALRLEITAS